MIVSFFAKALRLYLIEQAQADGTLIARTVAPAADLARLIGVQPAERRLLVGAVDELLQAGALVWEPMGRLYVADPPALARKEPLTPAERAKRYRATKASRGVTENVTGESDERHETDVTNVTEKSDGRDVTAVTNPSPSHSPSDLRSGSDLVLFPESSSGLSSDPEDMSGGARVAEKPSRKKPERPLPSDWEPSETELELAAKLLLNEPRERAKFKDSALAKDRRCADWNAAYRNWLRKSVEFSHISGKAPGLVAHIERKDLDAVRIEENARQEHRASLVDMAEEGTLGELVRQRWELGELTVDQLEELWNRRKPAGAA